MSLQEEESSYKGSEETCRGDSHMEMDSEADADAHQAKPRFLGAIRSKKEAKSILP